MKNLHYLFTILLVLSGIRLNAQGPKPKPDERKISSGSAVKSAAFTLQCAGEIHTPSTDLKWRPLLTTPCVVREPKIPDHEKIERIKAEKTFAKQKVNPVPFPDISAQSAVTPLVGANWPGNNNNGNSPMDNSIAISDGGIIVSVANTTLEIDDINGNLLFYNDLPTFFNDPQITVTCDPVVLYDRQTDKFILFFQECSGNSSNSNLCICFSQTNNPASGGWWKYKLTGNPLNNNCWFDYPKMAISNNELYITGNLFTNSGTFNQAILYQIEKANGFTGGNINWQFWSNISGNPFTLLPVSNGHGLPYGPGCFLVSTAAGGSSSINLYDLTDDMSASNEQLNFFSVPTTAYSPAGDAAQSGTTCLLDNGDCRSLSGFFLNGIIHFVFHSDIGGGWNGINYNRLNISNASNQSTTFGVAGSFDCSYPSVSSHSSTTTNSSVMIGYGRSGPSIKPEIQVINCDNNLNWSNSTLVKSSQGFVSFTSAVKERWGDYTGTARKHNSSPPSIWMNGMFGNSSNTWDSWIAEIFANSNVGTSENDNKEDFQLFPNPVVETFTLNFYMASASPLDISIYDNSGKMVKALFKGKGISGINNFSFNKANLKGGTYFLRVSQESKILKNEKIIITD